MTYKGTLYDEYKNEYFGDVKIPETVNYSSINYKVTSIGERAFIYCDYLTSIDIPNGVTNIYKYAFHDCRRLTSISIPKSLIKIGFDAFNYCSNLTEVKITDILAWCNISFENNESNPLTFAHNLYLNNQLVYELDIPYSVNRIGNYIFNGCTSLTSVSIPNSVISIGDDAFSGCTNLSSVMIGKSVKSIGKEVFANCNNLTDIISSIEEPYNINNNCFSGISKLNATLYIPKGTKEAYQAVTGWDFVNIDDGLVYYQLTLTGNEGGTITYNGQTIENTSASFEVREGKSATITVEPYEKYELSSLKMNGINVKKYMEENIFTADEIDCDVEIVATFDLKNPYITITPTNTLQTFCSEKNLNFSEVNGLTAYIVVGYKPSAKELLLTPVIEVPAGTGVLLKGEVGKTYKVPTMENSDYEYSNALVGVLEDEEVTTGFVFDETFKAVNGSTMVPANTAYLLIPAATEAGISELKGYLTDGPSVKGDINGDRRTDISDVVALVNIILGQ